MRTPSNATVGYFPAMQKEGITPAVYDELVKIATAIELLAAGHLDKTYVAPTKPRDGDIRYADGTSWNPGGTGAGIYWYNGSAWAKL